jgi:hypothetical protein
MNLLFFSSFFVLLQVLAMLYKLSLISVKKL